MKKKIFLILIILIIQLYLFSGWEPTEGVEIKDGTAVEDEVWINGKTYHIPIS